MHKLAVIAAFASTACAAVHPAARPAPPPPPTVALDLVADAPFLPVDGKYVYEDDAVRVELSPLAGHYMGAVTVRNKTADFIGVDLSRAVFVSWDRSAHKLTPSAPAYLPPGTTLRESLYVDGFDGGLPYVPARAAPESARAFDGLTYELYLPITVKGRVETVEASFSVELDREDDRVALR